MLEWIYDAKYAPKVSVSVSHLRSDKEEKEGRERGQSGRQRYRRGLRKLGRIAILWTKKNKGENNR